MYCRECGTELPNDAKFFHNCGVGTEVKSAKKFSLAKFRFKLSKKQIIATTSVMLAVVVCIVSLLLFYPTPERRVKKAFEKMQNMQQLNIAVDATVKTVYNDEPVTLYQTIQIKSDVTDPDNPISSVISNTTVEDQEMAIKSYYKDGYSYADSNSSFGYNTKIKQAVDYEQFEKDYLKMTKDIAIDPKTDIENAVIEKGENNDLYARFIVSGTAFTESLEEMIEYWAGNIPFELNSSGDCSLYVVVDKSNTITEMRFEYVLSVYVDEEPYDIIYNATFKYKEISDDFEVVIPDDADTYDLEVGQISSDFGIYDDDNYKVVSASYVQYVSICEIDETYYVKITFTDNGKEVFETVTTENVGRTLSIRVDNSIIMQPTVPEPIKDGAVTIPMNSLDEAEDLFDRITR